MPRKILRSELISVASTFRLELWNFIWLFLLYSKFISIYSLEWDYEIRKYVASKFEGQDTKNKPAALLLTLLAYSIKSRC